MKKAPDDSPRPRRRSFTLKEADQHETEYTKTDRAVTQFAVPYHYFDSDNPFIKLHGDERTFVTKRDRILCYTKFREDVLEHLAIVLPEEYSTSPIYDHYWSDDVIRATRLPQTHLLGSFIRSGRYRDIDESVIAISLREFGDYCLSLDLYRDIDELINELSLEDGPVLPYCGLTVSDLLSGEDMLSPHWVEDDILYLHDWRKFENA